MLTVIQAFNQIQVGHDSASGKSRLAIVFLGWLVLLTLLFPVSQAMANEPGQEVANQNVLEVFVRDGCPHCAEAKAYLPEFSRERPWLKIVYRTLDSDPAALDDLVRHSREAGSWPPGVPTFVFNGRVMVGFDSPERTGPELAALVEQRTADTGTIDAGPLGKLSVSSLGLPLFTLAVGLLDGFNPCAMWVLLFLLSLLVHQHNRKRMALIAGTFVLVSGAVYYAFMAAWLNVFLVMGMSAALRIVLGGAALLIGTINVRDFFSTGQGFTLSIPESAKPGLYARMRAVVRAEALLPALIAVTVLAVVVNFVELLCTAGFPALYTAILTQQHLDPAAYYAYLGLYIVGYIADDTLMVVMAIVMLSNRKLTEQTGRWLKLISGAAMLLLGGVMIFYPEWLR